MLLALFALGLSSPSPRAPTAVIAGGGIGGLCTALTLSRRGWEVSVFERTSEYRPFGGPIQIASNGLEALRQIDETLLDDVRELGNTIGDRKNGLKDGLSNEWFATFDLATPALRRDQVLSCVPCAVCAAVCCALCVLPLHTTIAKPGAEPGD
jgi:zeaxanthin epoxidase